MRDELRRPSARLPPGVHQDQAPADPRAKPIAAGWQLIAGSRPCAQNDVGLKRRAAVLAGQRQQRAAGWGRIRRLPARVVSKW